MTTTNLPAAWLILAISRKADHYYPWHVEGINGHALGTINERFCWSVPNLKSGFEPHPDATPEVRAMVLEAMGAT